jgi:predicted dehydrogenase
MVAFNYRKAPAIATARKLIEDGEIGPILRFCGRFDVDFALDRAVPLFWRFSKQRAGSGALGDLGAHVLDVARYLVGDVERVCAMADTHVRERPLEGDPSQTLAAVEVDDAVILLLRFAGGVPGVIESSRMAAGRKVHFAFEVNGERGSLAFDWERSNELRFYSTGDSDTARGFRTIIVGPEHPNAEQLWPVTGLGIGYAESTLVLVRDMLAAVTEGAPAVPDFHDGWRINVILDAALRSMDSEGWVAAG